MLFHLACNININEISSLPLTRFLDIDQGISSAEDLYNHLTFFLVILCWTFKLGLWKHEPSGSCREDSVRFQVDQMQKKVTNSKMNIPYIENKSDRLTMLAAAGSGGGAPCPCPLPLKKEREWGKEGRKYIHQDGTADDPV